MQEVFILSAAKDSHGVNFGEICLHFQPRALGSLAKKGALKQNWFETEYQF